MLQPCCIPGRVLLGRCLFGKLILKPSHRSGGIDLYWRGDSLIGALDHMLRDTISNRGGGWTCSPPEPCRARSRPRSRACSGSVAWCPVPTISKPETAALTYGGGIENLPSTYSRGGSSCPATMAYPLMVTAGPVRGADRFSRGRPFAPLSKYYTVQRMREPR